MFQRSWRAKRERWSRSSEEKRGGCSVSRCSSALRLTDDLPAEPPRCRDVILKPNMSCAARVSRVVPLHTHHCQIGDDKGQKWPLQCGSHAAFFGCECGGGRRRRASRRPVWGKTHWEGKKCGYCFQKRIKKLTQFVQFLLQFCQFYPINSFQS